MLFFAVLITCRAENLAGKGGGAMRRVRRSRRGGGGWGERRRVRRRESCSNRRPETSLVWQSSIQLECTCSTVYNGGTRQTRRPQVNRTHYVSDIKYQEILGTQNAETSEQLRKITTTGRKQNQQQTFGCEITTQQEEAWAGPTDVFSSPRWRLYPKLGK